MSTQPHPARARLTALLLLVLAPSGCHGGGDQAPEASVVLGVSADSPLRGQLQRVRVVVSQRTEGGASKKLFEETRETDGTPPLEIKVPPLPHGTSVTAVLEAYDNNGSDAPLLKRTARTTVVDGRTLLLRMRLNDECVAKDGERDVSCPSLTCSAGVCVLPFVAPQQLQDYRENWATPPVGNCGSVDGGEPTVTIGDADGPFMALSDGHLITPQRGLQGASHFFFSVRMSGADDANVLTHYYGRILSSGRETNVVSVADTYTPTQNGCELLSLPLILPPEDVANEVMRLGVTVSDGSGNAGHAHVDVMLAEPSPP